MNCSKCEQVLPHGAGFCHCCGAHASRAAGDGHQRRHSYAAHPGQSVLQFDVVTSLMPLASEGAPHTYRTAMLAAGLVPAVFIGLGWLPAAIVAAAVLVLVVYVVYLYDVNQWEDQPVPVVAGTVVVSAVLSVLFTLLAAEVLMPDDTRGLTDPGFWQGRSLLVGCLLVPVVGELLRQAGPVLLARRPAFDDLIDGVTFGVTSGAAYAAAETIVLNRHMIGGWSDVGHRETGLWLILVANAGLVKPIVLGSASGIAMARFSGVGPGYVGMGRGYVRGLAEAMAIVVCFELGLYWGDQVGGQQGALLALAVAAAVAVVAVLRIRLVLHTALLEAALEATQRQESAQHAVNGEAYCGHCDMPLLHGAAFCSACGTSTRAVPKPRRNFNSDAVGIVGPGAEFQLEGR